MHYWFILTLGLALTAVACGDEGPPAEEQQPQEEVQRPTTPAQTPELPVEPEPRPAPEATLGPGRGPLYTAQVAAFLSPDSATRWRDKLASQDLPVWTAVHEVEGRLFHRLRVGAASTESDARRVGEILKVRFGWPFWIAPVSAAESIPVHAVRATRNLIRGSGGGRPQG